MADYETLNCYEDLTCVCGCNRKFYTTYILSHSNNKKSYVSGNTTKEQYPFSLNLLYKCLITTKQRQELSVILLYVNHTGKGHWFLIRSHCICLLSDTHEPESYAGGSLATGRFSHARQVKGDDPDKKG